MVEFTDSPVQIQLHWWGYIGAQYNLMIMMASCCSVNSFTVIEQAAKKELWHCNC